jgi:hypothetical protein
MEIEQGLGSNWAITGQTLNLIIVIGYNYTDMRTAQQRKRARKLPK